MNASTWRTLVTSADSVAEFTCGQDFVSFEANRLLRSAVVHQLTIIGEAVAHLSPELRERHPEIPWSDIVGFRPPQRIRGVTRDPARTTLAPLSRVPHSAANASSTFPADPPQYGYPELT